MNKVFYVAISIFLGLFVLCLSFVLGVIYQTSIQEQCEVVNCKTLLGQISSNVISQIEAHGKVAKIDGDYLTLDSEGNTLLVQIQKDAAVYYSTINEANLKFGALTTTQKATREDIEVGDGVGIYLKLAGNNELVATTIYINSRAK